MFNNFQLNQSPIFSNFQEYRSVAGMNIFNLHVLRESLGFTYLQRAVLRLGIVWCLSLLCVCRSATRDLEWRWDFLRSCLLTGQWRIWKRSVHWDSEEYIYKRARVCWRHDFRMEAWKQWKLSYKTALTSSKIRVWITNDLEFFSFHLCAAVWGHFYFMPFPPFPFLDMLLY